MSACDIPPVGLSVEEWNMGETTGIGERESCLEEWT